MKVRVSFRILMGSIIAAGIFFIGLVIGIHCYKKDNSLYLKSTQRDRGMSNDREGQHFNVQKKPYSKKHLQISATEDLEFLDSQIKKIFPDGYSSLNDEVKTIEVLRFTVSYLKLKNNAGTATKILREQYAICGGMELVFKTLVRRLGIPVRYVGAFYLPYMGSHAASEVFYDNRWHFFDPTFGIFLYSKALYDGDGKIVSFREIASDPQSYYFFKVVEKPWVGHYDNRIRNYGIKPVEADYLEYYYHKPLTNMYLKNLSRNFPIAFGADRSISMPVDVDLRKKTSYHFGKKDQSYSDLALYSPRYSGSAYISSDAQPPCYHTWFVKTLEDKHLVIEYSFLSGQGEILIEPLRGVLVVSSKQKKNSLKVVLRTNDDFIAFKIYCEKGTWLIDNISIKYEQDAESHHFAK